MNPVYVFGTFEALQQRHASSTVRLLQEAARLGDVHALLWSDTAVSRFFGRSPRFPTEERRYFMQAVRFVASVEVIESLSALHLKPQSQWMALPGEDLPEVASFAQSMGLERWALPEADLSRFPPPTAKEPPQNRKKVVVTGTFDWLHSGHVRFFEEAAEFGALTVVVGHDANIQLLKGDGHPLIRQEERLYMVQSIRYVHQAMLSTGEGWLDAEPELSIIQPDMYVVNEDGDKDEKRDYCAQHGIEYLVLRREPKKGLSRRSSTALRGF